MKQFPPPTFMEILFLFSQGTLIASAFFFAYTIDDKELED